MKTFVVMFSLLFFVAACDKPVLPDYVLTDLQIIETASPASVSQNQPIVSTVKMSGPNLCYRFSYFTLYQQQVLVDVHAKATIPAKLGSCPTAIYYKDTTLSVPTTLKGKYVLRFYNGDQLFKADTVLVN